MGPGSDEIEDIRQQIDESRENLGGAVGALAYKADVKNRGKEALEDKKEAIMEKVGELKSKVSGDSEGSVGETIKAKLPSGEGVGEKLDTLKSKLPGAGDAAGRIGDAAPSKDDIEGKAQDTADAVRNNPIAVAAGAAAAGLVVGLALPETDLEREKLQPAAQNAREQVQSRAQELIAHAKDAAKDAVGSTADAVRHAGQDQGGKVGEIAEKATDKAREQVD
jgi:gas vesicle protein